MGTSRVLTLVIVSLACLTSSSASTIDPLEYRVSKELWIQGSKVMQTFSMPFLESFAVFLEELSIDPNTSVHEECRVGLYSFSSSLKSMSHEAVSIFDSFGKSHSGLLRGNRLSDFGHYDQCLHSRLNGSLTRYALLQLHYPLSKDHRVVKFDNDAVDPHGPSVPWFIKFSEKMGFLRFWPSLTAVCLPASCKARDIEKILESNVVKSYISPMRLSLYSHESLEDSISDFVQYPLLRRVSRIILYSLTVFTLLSTVTLYFIPRSQEEGYDNFLVHFDIISNWKRLVTPSAVTPNNKNMYVFNIAKTMYLFAGIFCHVYTGVFAKSHAYYSGITMHAMDTDFKNDIEWENFGVCVNFVLSGCMASLSLLPLMKARRVALSQAVLLRGLRTLPVVSACILLTLSFPLTSIGSGPLSLLVQINMTENCVKNAWRDLTFTSNFVPFREMCVPVTWFASADMQLFIVSWFLFGVMARGNKKQVVKYFILFLIGGWTAKALFLHLFSIEPVLFVASNDWFTTMKSLTIIQFNSLSYTGPYLVGVILGYLIHKEIFLVNKKYFKYLIAVSFGTIVAIYIMLPKIYDVTDGIRSNYSRKIEILFASTSRTFLCTAFAFLLYAAYMSGVRGEDDQEELVNKESRKELHEVNNNDNGLVCLLKHNVFNILSRLSFSIFMVHMFVIVFFQTSYRQISDFNSADIAMKGLYVSVMSLLPGLLMYLVVEAPFFNIVKSHLGKKIKSKSL